MESVAFDTLGASSHARRSSRGRTVAFTCKGLCVIERLDKIMLY